MVTSVNIEKAKNGYVMEITEDNPQPSGPGMARYAERKWVYKDIDKMLEQIAKLLRGGIDG